MSPLASRTSKRNVRNCSRKESTEVEEEEAEYWGHCERFGSVGYIEGRIDNCSEQNLDCKVWTHAGGGAAWQKPVVRFRYVHIGAKFKSNRTFEEYGREGVEGVPPKRKRTAISSAILWMRTTKGVSDISFEACIVI